MSSSNSNNNNDKDLLPNSFPMNGGNGTYSYSKNSSFQRGASIIVKALIDEAIAEKLDVENLSSSTSNTFRIADLGCSVGPNTFIAMQNVIEAVEKKYGLKPKLSNFQVFFNDHANNDFNTLFTSLPPEKHYFAAGVPGSFYGRLFPESSLHIVHSSYALQWLSRVPEEVQDKDSSAWNKGKIFYTSASDEVANAYAAQFAEDMNNFLNARAMEIVRGGMVLLIMPAVEDGVHRSQNAGGWLYDALGSSLMDMANEGLISEVLVDTFNLPIYTVSPKEMVRSVERNCSFSIERMKLEDPILRIDEPFNMHTCSMLMRASVEGLMTKHFGSEIIDQVFDRFHQKVAQFPSIDPSYKKGSLLFVALKRK